MPYYTSVRPAFCFRASTGNKLEFTAVYPVEVSSEAEVRECESYVPAQLNRATEPEPVVQSEPMPEPKPVSPIKPESRRQRRRGK